MAQVDRSAEEVKPYDAPDFNKALGVRFDEVSGDRVVLSCDITRSLQQPYGIVHGGVYCSLAETAASVAAAMWLGERGQVVGVANHTNFIRAAREGTLVTTATPVQRGRTQQLWRTEIKCGGKLIAAGEVRLANIESADRLGN